jgi:PAS domain S-box-containing protein/diguanylate cyclase (GGDEF)-like protein
MAENKPPRKILRILILDDSPDDAEQASTALRQGGYMLKTQRLETGVAVEQNLDSASWDLILCAQGLTNLPPRQVVELVTHKKLLIPVIVLARRVTDEELHALIRAGVRDVVVKGQWGRLLPVVERELAVVEEHRGWLETRETLRQLEARYRTMIEASIEAISYVQDGMHMDANPAYLRLFGYDNLDSLKETPLLNLIDKPDQARFKQALRKAEGTDKPLEFQVVTAGGNRIAIEVGMTPLTINGEACVQVVANDISKRKALEAKLQSMHQRDSLTGLFNRAHFLNALNEALKKPGGTLIGLTINRLAQLNQALGHVACDRLLVQIGLQLRDAAGSQALLARVAGGQFAVLLEPGKSAEAEALAGKIGKLLGHLVAGEGEHAMKPDVSLTPCKLDGREKNRQAVMDQVFKTETAVAYTDVPAATPAAAAPRASAAPAVPAAPAPKAESPPKAAPAAVSAAAGAMSPGQQESIRQALAQNRTELLFQPIINLHGEPRCYYEAMLMLRTADGNLVPPLQYLPAAESAGLAGKVDRAMMLGVIDTLSKYQLEGRPGIVFVKLSSAAVHDNTLLAAMQMHMKATGLNPSSLVLEINETALAKNPGAAKMFIQKAAATGVALAIDHFTNQAVTIETLAALPVDFYAVDCTPGGLPENVLYGAIDAVHALDKTIIGRGLNDADLFSVLFNRGVHYIQGDYIQAASPGLDYSFEAEQTLASDEPLGPNWRAAV